LERGLLSARLDLALVTARPQISEELTLEPLLEDPLFVAVARGHRLAGAGRVDPAALRDERWIAAGTDRGSTLLGAWVGDGWRPKITYRVYDWTAKIGLVAAGCGITIVPGLAVAALPGSVALVAIEHPQAVRSIAIARREAADLQPSAEGLIEALRDSRPGRRPAA
jgi:DNA-binding transcriptional LysR family regulator